MTRTSDTAVVPQTLRAVQTTAVLSVLVLAWQFFTAGQIITDEDAATGGHGAGAIALHVSTFLLLAAAVLHGRATQVCWPAVLAAVVLVVTFVQAYLGSSENIAAHVPLALGLTIGIVWLTAWSFWPVTT
jgi:hypothetical protein